MAMGGKNERSYRLGREEVRSNFVIAHAVGNPSNVRAPDHNDYIPTGQGVRRLTPRECERLQALPDDYTAHGPDSRRYTALGDAGDELGERVDRTQAGGGVSPTAKPEIALEFWDNGDPPDGPIFKRIGVETDWALVTGTDTSAITLVESWDDDDRAYDLWKEDGKSGH